MKNTDNMTDLDRLREIALDQYGYVTAGQAEGEGVSRFSLAALARRGRIERDSRGLYFMPQVTDGLRGPLMRAVLWAGEERAVLSHETALDLYGVCDINPIAIHVTVPKGQRISKAGGDGITLHHENLLPSQTEWWHRIPTVRLKDAIRQCIEWGTSAYLVRQAIDNSRMQHLISNEEAGALEKMLDERGSETGGGRTDLKAWTALRLKPRSRVPPEY